MQSIQIYVNERECTCQTTRQAVEMFLRYIKFKGKVIIKNYFKLPISQGFATSSSGTLAALIALKEALGIDVDHGIIINLAHISEIMCKTGLGSVISQVYGGITIRKSPGSLKYCNVEKLTSDKYLIFYIVGREIKTRELLRHRVTNYQLGKVLLKIFLKNKSLRTYIKLSRRFIFELKVHDIETLRLLKRYEEFTANCFGNVIYTITDEPERFENMLTYPYIVTRIYNKSLFTSL